LCEVSAKQWIKIPPENKRKLTKTLSKSCRKTIDTYHTVIVEEAEHEDVDAGIEFSEEAREHSPATEGEVNSEPELDRASVGDPERDRARVDKGDEKDRQRHLCQGECQWQPLAFNTTVKHSTNDAQEKEVSESLKYSVGLHAAKAI
jgi:hypothetical protein